MLFVDRSLCRHVGNAAWVAAMLNNIWNKMIFRSRSVYVALTRNIVRSHEKRSMNVTFVYFRWCSVRSSIRVTVPSGRRSMKFFMSY
jgi:hypothetical protein